VRPAGRGPVPRRAAQTVVNSLGSSTSTAVTELDDRHADKRGPMPGLPFPNDAASADDADPDAEPATPAALDEPSLDGDNNGDSSGGLQIDPALRSAEPVIDPALYSMPLSSSPEQVRLCRDASCRSSSRRVASNRVHPLTVQQPPDAHHAPHPPHAPPPAAFSPGPQGDPFAPQPTDYFPIPDEPPPPTPQPKHGRRKRRPQREPRCGFCRGDDSANKHGQPEAMVSCASCGRSGPSGRSPTS
jgi:hypothetical protein